jgi:hypothetical protein
MQITHTSNKHQQNRINAYRVNSDSNRFFNLLTSDIMLDKVEELLPEHRERLYPPTETLSLFLAQAMSADRSCQHAVNQAALHRLFSGLTAGSTRTGGYCRARQRLPVEMVSNLTQHLGEHIIGQLPDDWCWQGRRVRLIDGTTVTMPDTLANQAIFRSSVDNKLDWGSRFVASLVLRAMPVGHCSMRPLGILMARAVMSRRCCERFRILFKKAMS